MVAVTGGKGGPRVRPTLLHLAVFVFFLVAVASVVVNLESLVALGQSALAVKKLALLASYIAFFAIVASTVRARELPAFSVLTVGLAVVAALGTIYEYRTRTNVFYTWSRDVLPASVDVSSPNSGFISGRASVLGPTHHPLAITAILAFAMSFAVVGAMSLRKHAHKILSAIAALIIMAGIVATARKTGAVAPALVLGVIVVYRPRALIGLIPAGAVGIPLMQVIAPGALANLRDQFLSDNFFQTYTTRARTEDYDAIVPDLLAHPFLGRGYGTYDPFEFRIIDNEYLLELLHGGLFGAAAYLAMVVAVFVVAHPVIRSDDSVLAPVALAAAGAAAAFGSASVLFDVMSFPQAPYLFFFSAGLAASAGAEHRVRAARARGRPPGAPHPGNGRGTPSAPT